MSFQRLLEDGCLGFPDWNLKCGSVRPADLRHGICDSSEVFKSCMLLCGEKKGYSNSYGIFLFIQFFFQSSQVFTEDRCKTFLLSLFTV